MSYMHRLLNYHRGLKFISVSKTLVNESVFDISNRNNNIIRVSLSYSRLSFLTHSHIQNVQKKSLFSDQGQESIFQKRSYAKGKDKGKDKGGTRSNISEEELADIINVDNFKRDIEHAIESLKENYLLNLSVRSSIGSLENLLVELEGEKFPLSEIAQVIRKSPTMVIINATDFPQASMNIKKAIQESGMNLNPQQDGTTFFIPIPKVTKEHREKLAQNAKSFCDKTKAHLREVQNKYVKKIKSKDGQVSNDLIFNGQIKIREMTKEAENKVELMMKNKQNELLKLSK